MANELLRRRLLAADLTVTDLAGQIGVDPKTVERWIATDRVPQPRHRQATAEALGVMPRDLWPDPGDSRYTRIPSEVRAVYPTRGHVPARLWRRCLEASRNVDVLVYSGLFLIDTHPDLPTTLKDRAAEGLHGRFLFGDPESEVVRARGVEEGIGENLSARVRLSLTYMDPVSDVAGIEIRTHRTILYNSLYRFDDELLVNTHVAGSPAPVNPVLHLVQAGDGGLFDAYMRSFDRVWQSAAM